MRKLAVGAALSGALALVTLTGAGAHADEIWGGDTTIVDVNVNGGRDIAVGTTNTVTIKGSVTVTDPDGMAFARWVLWHGSDYFEPEAYSLQAGRTCTDIDATTIKCAITATIDPQDLPGNSVAGKWYVAVDAYDEGNGGIAVNAYTTVHVKRYSRLSVNASPEPVTRGKTITVTGRLTRADWETFDYRAYPNQPVKLQFRKAGASTFSTVKTVYTNSYGNLKTTVTASTDGYWRYFFPGTTTTAPVKATSDFVDVKAP
ncbi:calcium-binding protein [Streptomyces cavernae]|uniref:calcium-binding protein n=1 Tax=Streptomyces cavernae TaxID=2259034 RepID=UPI000FEBB652|nr:calcium-binding protein [Streptomyces cavernae]